MTAQIPEQADTAPDLARQWRAEADATWTAGNQPRTDEEDYRRTRAAVLRECADEFEAVAPAIRDQAHAEHLTERDLMHADLGDLLEATGLGNYARPESPHDVMQQAIAKVREIVGRPALIIKIDGELTGETREQLKRDYLAAIASGAPPILLPNRDTAERVAELEQLARDILSHFTASGDGRGAP